MNQTTTTIRLPVSCCHESDGAEPYRLIAPIPADTSVGVAQMAIEEAVRRDARTWIGTLADDEGEIPPILISVETASATYVLPWPLDEDDLATTPQHLRGMSFRVQVDADDEECPEDSSAIEDEVYDRILRAIRDRYRGVDDEVYEIPDEDHVLEEVMEDLIDEDEADAAGHIWGPAIARWPQGYRAVCLRCGRTREPREIGGTGVWGIAMRPATGEEIEETLDRLPLDLDDYLPDPDDLPRVEE